MNKVSKDNFWETDLDKLPGALKIDYNTKILYQGKIYTQTQEIKTKLVDKVLNK